MCVVSRATYSSHNNGVFKIITIIIFWTVSRILILFGKIIWRGQPRLYFWRTEVIPKT
jgi:hypothetical protein